MAASRRPSTQATTRRAARSTANQSHTLRRRRPTDARISSSSSASHRSRCAFLGRRRGGGGHAACAFFCQLGHRRARHAGHAHDAALRVAFGQHSFSTWAQRAARPPRAQTGPGSRRLCIGSGHARCCGRCGESARCRIWHKRVESLPQAQYATHPNLDHRHKLIIDSEGYLALTGGTCKNSS